MGPEGGRLDLSHGTTGAETGKVNTIKTQIRYSRGAGEGTHSGTFYPTPECWLSGNPTEWTATLWATRP